MMFRLYGLMYLCFSCDHTVLFWTHWAELLFSEHISITAFLSLNPTASHHLSVCMSVCAEEAENTLIVSLRMSKITNTSKPNMYTYMYVCVFYTHISRIKLDLQMKHNTGLTTVTGKNKCNTILPKKVTDMRKTKLINCLLMEFFNHQFGLWLADGDKL